MCIKYKLETVVPYLFSTHGMNPVAGSSRFVPTRATWAGCCDWRSPSPRRNETQPPVCFRTGQKVRL